MDGAVKPSQRGTGVCEMKGGSEEDLPEIEMKTFIALVLRCARALSGRVLIGASFLAVLCLQNLCRWVLSVKKNYRKSVAYHNWRHAFNTAQSMFALLKSGRLQVGAGADGRTERPPAVLSLSSRPLCRQNKLNDLEVLALMIATLSHDLDHRGVNNSYIQR